MGVTVILQSNDTKGNSLYPNSVGAISEGVGGKCFKLIANLMDASQFQRPSYSAAQLLQSEYK